MKSDIINTTFISSTRYIKTIESNLLLLSTKLSNLNAEGLMARMIFKTLYWFDIRVREGLMYWYLLYAGTRDGEMLSLRRWNLNYLGWSHLSAQSWRKFKGWIRSSIVIIIKIFASEIFLELSFEKKFADIRYLCEPMFSTKNKYKL